MALLNMPAFQASPLMDLTPIAQALAMRQRQMEAEANRAMQERQFAEGQRQFNAQNALARDQFGLSARTADRADETAPLQRDLLAAQAAQARAHAGYYGAGAANLRARAEPPAQGAVAPQIGINERGEAYLLPTSDAGDATVDRRVAGAGETIDGSATREHTDYGPYGRTTATVPGVVVTDKGKSDQFATKRLEQQRALDSGAIADRERAIEHMKVQQAWSQVHGRPPRAGKMYDKKGFEVDIGPLSASADAIERKDRAIEAAKGDIAEAEKTLTSGLFPGAKRILAPALAEMGPVGRGINNVTGLEDEKSAFDKTKMAVMQTVYALSGKTTTNKELENFLDNFMPRGGESDVMLRDKMARLRKFLGTLQGKVKTGMVYDQAEAEAMGEAASADFGKQQGRLPQNENSAVRKFKNKYQGLE